jgi:3-methyladenine DNA glycosylase/8-oxoguanine DNA glycosylase
MRARFEVLSRYTFGVLSSEPTRFSYLLQPPRRTLLFYLGKIGNPELTKRVATAVCEQRLTVARAQALIYRVTRRARPAPPLAEVVSKALDEYAQRYPEQYLQANVPETLRALAIDFEGAAARDSIAA